MNYYQVDFQANSEEQEVLIARLFEFQFESFVEEESTLQAFIAEDTTTEDNLTSLLNENFSDKKYTFKLVQQRNWNEEWEKNYDPVFVKDQVIVKAPFHTDIKPYPWEILIEPKMAFGTGHHETTHLMLTYILETEVGGLSVLDMGCGSGVLGIFAAMKGAFGIVAIDNDEWSYRNTVDNAKNNAIENLEAIHGDASNLGDNHFDLILANINRNILLEDMHAYVSVLKAGGNIIFSGIYDTDFETIKEKAESLGLIFESKKHREEWIACRFEKN